MEKLEELKEELKSDLTASNEEANRYLENMASRPSDKVGEAN